NLAAITGRGRIADNHIRSGTCIVEEIAERNRRPGYGDGGAEFGGACGESEKSRGGEGGDGGDNTHEHGFHPLLHVRGDGHHLVQCGDDLGVHVIGALCGDERGDFAYRIHVGRFEKALQHAANAIIRGDADIGGTACRCFDEEIVTQRIKASFIGKRGKLDLTHNLRSGFARQCDLYLTIAADCDVGRFRRNVDAGCERVAIGCDELAIRADLKGTGARVSVFTAWQFNAKIAATLNGEVELVLGIVEIALCHDAVHRRDLHTHADLHACGNDGSRVRGVGADATEVLVEQVLKLGALALE